LMRGVDRIVLLGGGRLLRQIVEWAKSDGGPIVVVTSPRHAAETYQGLSLSGFLTQLDVPHHIADDIGMPDVSEFLGDTSTSFCLSLGAPWIFKAALISDLFGGRLFNLHGTRLPQNRGGGGFSWQILMGGKFGFCQLHLIDGGVDTGDIIRTREFLYPTSCRIPADFQDTYTEKNLEFVVEFIEEVRSNGISLETRQQSEYLSTYWPRLGTDINGLIDWDDEAVSLERFICAFDRPYTGAKSTLRGKVVHIRRVSVDHSDGSFHRYQRGIVFRKSKDWICVAIRGGTLIIEELNDENGDNILTSVRPGDRFESAATDLEAALRRVMYTPKG